MMIASRQKDFATGESTCIYVKSAITVSEPIQKNVMPLAIFIYMTRRKNQKNLFNQPPYPNQDKGVEFLKIPFFVDVPCAASTGIDPLRWKR